MSGYYYKYDTSVNQFVLFVPPIPTTTISPQQPFITTIQQAVQPQQPPQPQQSVEPVKEQPIPSMVESLSIPLTHSSSPQSNPIPSMKMISPIDIELAKKHPPPPLPPSSSSDNNEKKVPSMLPISLPDSIFSKKSPITITTSNNNNNSIQQSPPPPPPQKQQQQQQQISSNNNQNTLPVSPTLQPVKHVKTISPYILLLLYLEMLLLIHQLL